MKIKRRDAIAQLLDDQGRGLAQAFDLFIEGLNAKKDARLAIKESISNLEQGMDQHRAVLLTKVEDTFITPFDREDLLLLTECIDDVIDCLDNTIDLLIRMKITELPDLLLEIAKILHSMGQDIPAMLDLIKKPKKFRKEWDSVTARENQLDTMHNELTANVLSGKLDIFEAMRLKQIADRLEEISNLMEFLCRNIAVAAIKET